MVAWRLHEDRPPPGLPALLDEIGREARRVRPVLDLAAYRAAGRDPTRPILCVGPLDARVCLVGRDLGAAEVTRGEPLVGPSGRLVREALGATPALLTNLVPYKPAGNLPFPASVRDRFRPYLERLLVFLWRGELALPLGTHALAWFAPYAERGAVRALGARSDRHGQRLRCRLVATWGDTRAAREITVCPLPHPSPANVIGRSRFRELLEGALS